MTTQTTGYAPDGSPVEVFARLGAGSSPELISAALPPRAPILDLGCGAGRLADPLSRRGHAVTAVDQSAEMLARVQLARPVQARIEDLHLGERFAGVLLSSYLVNLPQAALRRSFLETCVRHLLPGGRVFIQRLDPPRARRLGPGPTGSRNGVDVSLTDVAVHGQLVSATTVFTYAGREWRQSWTFVILDDDELAGELAALGLSWAGGLGGGLDWVVAEAVPADTSR
jgi:SAM-dependent methyltransferase